MRTLVGITNFTHAKDYVMPAFHKMAERCITPVVGHENVMVVSERSDPVFNTQIMPVPGVYAEDMLTASRDYIMKRARREGFDRVVLQGVDALYQTRKDFENLISRPVEIVAPLICARNMPHMAVARRFIRREDKITEEQVDIPRKELMSGKLIKSGFPGADNIVITKNCFDIPFAEGHKPWYKRVADGEHNLCVEENWVRNALIAGHQAWVDTSIKVYHVHEDCIAGLYPNKVCQLKDLRWG